MDIQELIKEKTALNEAIAKLVTDFQQRTDILVSEIAYELSRYETAGSRLPRAVVPVVNVRLSIE